MTMNIFLEFSQYDKYKSFSVRSSYCAIKRMEMTGKTLIVHGKVQIRIIRIRIKRVKKIRKNSHSPRKSILKINEWMNK